MHRPPSSTRRAFLKASATSLLGLGTTSEAQACRKRGNARCWHRHCPRIPRAAFTCDFGISNDLTPAEVVQELERDRMHLSARPGFIHKHVPLGINPADGTLSSGGRYLFTTVPDAVAYKKWLSSVFILDSTRFFDRPYILNPDCRLWSVVGRFTGSNIAGQVVTRMERWQVAAGLPLSTLQEKWPAIVDGARRRRLTAVWLLEELQGQHVALVYYRDHVLPTDPQDHGDPQKVAEATLLGLKNLPPLGQAFDDLPWTKTLDRTQWIMTTWFPFVSGDRGWPPLWPNSPPLPG